MRVNFKTMLNVNIVIDSLLFILGGVAATSGVITGVDTKTGFLNLLILFFMIRISGIYSENVSDDRLVLLLFTLARVSVTVTVLIDFLMMAGVTIG